MQNVFRMRNFGIGCIVCKTIAHVRSRLLNNKPLPVCYDGFEPSGRMHIAQGIMKANNVNKLTKSGACSQQAIPERCRLPVYLLGC